MKTVREKLARLLIDSPTLAVSADYLISNGVTIPVRCRDCYYWEKDDEKDDAGCCLNPDGLVNYARPDDFCSCGERKEEA